MIAAVPDTVIVAGDFNTTVNSVGFRTFLAESRLSDARAGSGWQPSWLRGSPVALSLDHILYRGEAMLAEFRVGAAIGSDHRPLYAEFTLPSQISL
jgi:endonuclease/exonuclease/phosphatase (EEP) superfamily protein YafD